MRRTAFLASMIVASLCAPFIAEASTRRDDVSDATHIALGNSFASVGSLSTGAGFGSATLIGSNWILTAGHMNPSNGSSGTFNLGGTNYTVTNLQSNPNWTGDLNAGFDFAVGFIAGGVAGVTPSPYYVGSGEVGRTGTSVGYGVSGTGTTGGTGSAGTKRGFTNDIDLFDTWAFLSDFDNPSGTTSMFGSTTALATEGNVTPGDSGGGLFVDFGSGPWLVGVTSFVFDDGPGGPGPDGAPWGRYGQGSGWGDIDQVAAWVQQTTGIAPVPEPSSLIALGLGGFALLRRHRKHLH